MFQTGTASSDMVVVAALAALSVLLVCSAARSVWHAAAILGAFIGLYGLLGLAFEPLLAHAFEALGLPASGSRFAGRVAGVLVWLGAASAAILLACRLGTRRASAGATSRAE